MSARAETAVSIAPDRSEHRIPTVDQVAIVFGEIAAAAEEHCRRGGTVVAVQGLGFVGTAVCAALAAARTPAGEPTHFVVGVDLLRPETYWKVAKIEAGDAPVASPDAGLDAAIAQGHRLANLRATAAVEAFALADVVVVDVDLGFAGTARGLGTLDAEVEIARFEQAVRAVGRQMRPDALVVVETTVPVGTCRTVVLPSLLDERLRRGIEEPVLLANAYERVMPGPRYLESVRAYPRSFAGLDADAARRTREFLLTFVDARRAPIRELPDLESAELGKLLENSYRAANIAFIHEWTRLAESIGIDLWSVIDSIRVRAGTHDNIRDPGLGVGGYCLTKDSLLAQWGATNLLGSDVVLETTLNALKTNYLMPLHTFEHIRALAGGDLEGQTIALLGVTYLPAVADTRNAPSETLLAALEAAGAEVRVHDPQVVWWPEQPDVTVHSDLRVALHGVDGVVLAVPHAAYRDLTASDLMRLVGRPAFVVDAQNVLSDGAARALEQAGWRVSGVGKGHWRTDGLGRGA